MSWCAVCGGGPERAQADTLDGDLPRCGVCQGENRGLLDWNPRTRTRRFVRPDGNATNAQRDPEAWTEWVRISESWGHP